MASLDGHADGRGKAADRDTAFQNNEGHALAAGRLAKQDSIGEAISQDSDARIAMVRHKRRSWPESLTWLCRNLQR